MGYKRKRTDSAFTSGSSVVKDTTFAPKTYGVKNKKAVKVKRVRKVKVSKALRAKITKVIDKQPNAIYGTREDIFMAGKMYALTNQQTLFNGCGVQLYNNDALTVSNGWHFTVPMFYDVCNVLFGTKTITFAPMVDQYKVGQATQFNAKNTKFEVMNSYSTYLFKNNSQHLVTIKLIIGVPKQKGSNCEWTRGFDSQNAEGATFTNLEAINDIETVWRAGITTDVNTGYLLGGFSPGYGNVANAPTVKAPAPEEIDRDPNQCQALKNQYKLETITLMLQPGQEVMHKIQGPQKQVIDFTKLYKNNLLQNIQKYSRNVLGIMYNSPNAAGTVDVNGVITAAVGGRYGDFVDNQQAGFVVHVERRDHYKIRMPEQTGFVLESAVVGSHQTLNKRFKKTQYNVLNKAKPDIGAFQVIDLSVMNPQAPVSAGPGTGT